MFLPFSFMNVLVTATFALFWLASSAGFQLTAVDPQMATPRTSRPVQQAVEARIAKAQDYLRQDRTSEAQALLQDVLKGSPNSIRANNLLGSLLLKEKRFPEAEEHFELVLRVEPRNETARQGERDAAVGLALGLRRAGDGPASLLALQRAETFLPDDADLLTDIGVEADALHDYDRAAAALNGVLKQKPGDPVALYALARTESDREHPQQAEKLFHAYLALRPNDATAHYGLGRLLQRQQRTEEAEAEFQRSLELQPLQTESYYQLGQMALDGHRDTRARAMFEKTLSRLPTHGGARTGMGILDYRAKQFESARGSLEQAIASSPDYEPAHYYLGLTLSRLGDKVAAKRELDVAAQLAHEQQNKSKPVGVVDPRAATGP